MARTSCCHFSLVALLVLSPVAAHLEPTAQLNNVSDYQNNYSWILAVGIIAGFFMAWGIGANDVANSFATSVGSKALTLRQAVAIATVCEFVGCISMGASVTDTVRSGFIDEAYFKNNPEVLQLAMLAALLGAGTWLALCSSLGTPVSTTHSIIGSLVGVSLVANPNSLNTTQLGLVVLSWITSPLLSGILAASVFLLVRTFILRSPDAVSRGYKFYPVLLLITNLIFCMYVVFKNPQVEIKDFVAKTPGAAVGVALGLALFFTSVVFAITFRSIQRSTEAVEEEDVKKDSELAATAEAGANVVVEVSLGDALKPEAETQKAAVAGRFFDQDLHAQAMAEGGETQQMHESAEKFPAKTEKLFTYLQVVSACFDSLAHGANDVANSVGPLAAIVGIHQTAKVDSKIGKVGNISTAATKDSQKARFKSYDSNGDGTLDDSELKMVGLNKNIAGDKLVEKFGRRRRRTPKTLTEKDFLQFTCTSKDNLEHLLYKNCEPVCLDGFRANKELSCKINPAKQDATGNFQLATYYSGFSACGKK
ncbi:unnamed protein product [Polarella glacialis]|uniref:Phosphate transporter n=1 Tax=Polarella glacialis TaxID=89957 RepID=A0A813E3H0_POLGL|nr:unnamed protein product [Polarella glacialis]